MTREQAAERAKRFLAERIAVEEFVPSAGESFYGGGSQEYVFRVVVADELASPGWHTGGGGRVLAVSMETGAIRVLSYSSE